MSPELPSREVDEDVFEARPLDMEIAQLGAGGKDGLRRGDDERPSVLRVDAEEGSAVFDLVLLRRDTPGAATATPRSGWRCCGCHVRLGFHFIHFLDAGQGA